MTNYATAKQIAFLNTLATERVVPQGLTIETSGLTISGASNIIDVLLKQPRKAAAVAARPADRLQEVPSSKYAIGFDTIADSGIATNGNTLLFVEVRTWKGRKFLNRLHGAPGAFRRSRLTVAQVATVAEVILESPLEAAQAFGEHHHCCGSCGAELTDDLSRARRLGPECWKKFNH